MIRIRSIPSRGRLPLPALALAAALLAAACAVLWWQPAQADELISSEPPAAETVDHAPEAILLTFDEPLLLEPGANSVALVDAEGLRVDDGKAEIAGYSPRSLIVRPVHGTELEGVVEVAYVVTFASGESQSGSFAFTVDAEFAGEPEEEGEAGIATPESEQGVVLWTLAIVAAIALFALLAYYLRYATDNAKSSLEEPSDDAHH